MTYDPRAAAAAAMGQEPDEDALQQRIDAIDLRIIDLAGLEAIPPPEFLIDGYLIKNSLAWLGGKPGHYKSFVAVDFACCVGTGTNWHGYKVTKGKVLYLIAEGVTGLAQRFRAWSRYHGVPVENVVFLPMPLRLADPTSIDVAALASLLPAYKPDLAIIDTQARVTVGADENSSRDMGEFVDALEVLREINNSTMLTVHHEPRNATNLRGSISLEGGAATILRCFKEGDQLTIEMTKQKDAPELDELPLTAYPCGESIVLDEPDPTMEGKSTTGNEQKIIDTLMGWPGFEAPGGELRDATELSKSSFYLSLGKLVNKRKVNMRESGNTKYYSVPAHLRPQPHGV
jgi:Cu/Ag efflux protein CusF